MQVIHNWIYKIIVMKTTFYLTLALCLSVGTAFRSCIDPGCSVCNADKITCTTCQDGHFLESGFCIPCIDGCQTCPSAFATTCTTCMANWNKAADDTCFKCARLCKTCTGTRDNCATCHQGFEISAVSGGGQTCVKKTGCTVEGCDTCENSRENTCQTCSDGYLLFLGNCFPCEFPASQCSLAIDDVITNEVIPFVQALQASGATGPAVPAGGIDLFTLDVNNIQAAQKPWLVFGYLIYKPVEDQVFRAVQRGELTAGPTLDLQMAIGTQTLVNQVIALDAATASLSIDQVMLVASATILALTGKTVPPADFENLLRDELNQVRVADQCLPEFYKTGPTCASCNQLIGCKLCSDVPSCLQCEEGKILEMGTCEDCHESCETCSASASATACTSCEAPAFLNANNECVVCDPPCTACQGASTDVCILCEEGYSLVASTVNPGECFRCDDRYCEMCDDADPATCLFCLEGRFLKNGTCTSCQNNCDVCREDAGNLVCEECSEGFYRNPNGLCAPCIPGCALCQTGSECLECFEGAYLNELDRCSRCPEYCETCNEDQECITFAPGIGTIQGQIVELMEGCLQGDPRSFDICLEAEEGFFLVAGELQECLDDCQKCADGASCDICEYGFAFAGGICGECTPNNCIQCNPANLSQCTRCSRKYTLQNGECVNPCQQYCVKCKPGNSSQCTECIQGFAPGNNGKCVKCLGDCNGGNCNPKDIRECVSCGFGFELKDGNCIMCPSLGTKKCVNGNSKECFPFFRLREKTDGSFECVPKCIGHCDTCNGVGRTTCTRCDTGYKLQGGKCLPDYSACQPRCKFCPAGSRIQNKTSPTLGQACIDCPGDCEVCDANGCITCSEGYYKNAQGACVVCENNCLVCSSQKSCLRCMEGYFRQNVAESGEQFKLEKKCTQCDNTKCKTCVLDSDVCTSCPDGKILKGTDCIGRYTTKFEVTIDALIDEFLANGDVQTFLERVVALVGVDLTQAVLTSVVSGSVVVLGDISADSQAQADQNSQTLSDNTNNLGVTVTSSSFQTAFDGSVVTQDTTSTSSSGASVGLIVGCTIGGIVLIAIIAFVVYKVKTGKSDSQQVEIDDTRVQNEKDQIVS